MQYLVYTIALSQGQVSGHGFSRAVKAQKAIIPCAEGPRAGKQSAQKPHTLLAGDLMVLRTSNLKNCRLILPSESKNTLDFVDHSIFLFRSVSSALISGKPLLFSVPLCLRGRF